MQPVENVSLTCDKEHCRKHHIYPFMSIDNYTTGNKFMACVLMQHNPASVSQSAVRAVCLIILFVWDEYGFGVLTTENVNHSTAKTMHVTAIPILPWCPIISFWRTIKFTDNICYNFWRKKIRHSTDIDLCIGDTGNTKFCPDSV